MLVCNTYGQFWAYIYIGKEREIKSATTDKSYDDSSIDDKEQVRDLRIMMSNTADKKVRKADAC